MNNRVQRYRKFGSVAKKFGADLTRCCQPANSLGFKHLFAHFEKGLVYAKESKDNKKAEG